MKKLILASIAAAALCGTPVLAADAPMKAAPAPMWNWTGFYVGAQGGYAWKEDGFNWAPEFPLEHGKVHGWEAGGTVGYNVQVGKSVIGLEADWSWANIKGGIINANCGVGFICGTRVDDFGTARARIGMLPTQNFLLYATAGGAWAHVDRGDLTGPAGEIKVWRSRSGWTVGGGGEWMLSPNWTMKLEYLYVDLGTGPLYPASGTLNAGHQSTSFNVVRAGLNYKFW